MSHTIPEVTRILNGETLTEKEIDMARARYMMEAIECLIGKPGYEYEVDFWIAECVLIAERYS